MATIHALRRASEQLRATLDFDRDRAEQRFRYWQVETLLNRSADLLDRCLGDANRHQDLLAKEALLADEIEFSSRATKIAQQRLNDGIIERVRHNLTAQRDSLAKMEGAYTAAVDNFGNARTDLSDNALSSAEGVLQQQIIAKLRWEYDKTGIDQALDWQSKDESRQAAEFQNSMDQLAAKEQKRLPGGPLDFKGQADALIERMRRDFNEACDMLHVASNGLKLIYSYPDVPFERVLSTGAKDPGFNALLEQAVNWGRNAIRWVSAFSQNDQAFTVSFPLTLTLGAEDWKRLLEGGVLVSFRLPNAHLNDFDFVRLRGVSATSVTSDLMPYPIKVSIRPPTKAQYTLPDQAPNIVDQLKMPMCRLGRVYDVRIPNLLETYGQVSLMNASPLGVPGEAEGKWLVSIEASDKKLLTKISEVVVDLRLTGQPR